MSELSKKEINKRLAEMMGWTKLPPFQGNDTQWYDKKEHRAHYDWQPTENIEQCFICQNALKNENQRMKYTEELIKIIYSEGCWKTHEAMFLIYATAEQRATALIRVIGE